MVNSVAIPAEVSRHFSPSVSIIVVTFNRADLLDKTIQSLLNQSLRDFELIIADDASRDHTKEICAKYAAIDSRIRIITNPSNVGMPGNLNNAITFATGEFVAILHDDDIYRADLLEKWKNALDHAPRASFVFNAYEIYNPQSFKYDIIGAKLQEVTRGKKFLENICFRRMLFGSPVWGCAMVRRSSLADANLLDPRFGFWADVDLWLRLAEQSDVAYVDEPLIRIRPLIEAPHLFSDDHATQHKVLTTMFYEARLRRFRGRPIRLFFELSRHYLFSLARNARHFVLSSRRKIIAHHKRPTGVL